MAKDTTNAPRPRLVVIGNGMAGCRAVEEILALAPVQIRHHHHHAERQVNYNRIMLSPLLAGDKTFDEIVLNGASWYLANGIDLITGCSATGIDRDNKIVALDDGRTVPYDALILACGSNPFMPLLPGTDLPGVVTFRSVDDVGLMLHACETRRARRGDRRRFAWPGSCGRARQERHGRHRHSLDAHSNGAPTRSISVLSHGARN